MKEKGFLHKLIFFSVAVGLLGCTGYRPVQAKNPLYYYGITSVSVPQFINKSIIPSISGPLTKSIFLVLAQYPGLTVYAGENSNADAILIGVIESKDHREKVFNHGISRHFIDDDSSLKQSIGNRPGFYVNSESAYAVYLRLILIKNPDWQSLALAQSDLSSQLLSSPQIILNESLALQGSYSHALDSNTGPDDGGVTNFTKTKGIYDQSLQSIGQTAADWFRGVVMNAF
ncbi:MAG: hypothetical protein A2X86_06475 [Bdellovibrionales bacterium GWA2_49_15]|nr:MAG: hypothetical protein A2X86_06475 [Bdellovibrionales bacterium GWA2_49_15]HAZ12082.1 hypothetical protein [Bdellovibrionales bacterium]